MRKYILPLILVLLLLSNCMQDSSTNEIASNNPLLMEWETPFGVPPFDLIEDQHYQPAFESAMSAHMTEIDAIITNKEAPTFENTIEALERSGADLSRVSRVFFAVNGAHSNDSIREIAKIMSPRLSAHGDDISLNADLYAKVKSVYDQKESLELRGEQLRLLDETHKEFVRSGISLDIESQSRLREINTRLAELSQSFGQNLLAETNDFEMLVTEREKLGNLPESLVAAAAKEAESRDKEGWVFTLSRPSINPFLQYSPDRELRKKIFMGYAMRGDNGNDKDNKAILSEMASLRAERANLMGYETHAHFILSDNVAENPDKVYGLLDQLWEPALRVSVEEKNALEDMMHDDGIEGELEGWDWRYYVEKVRKARYDLDEDQLRPYFEFNAVKGGVFTLATNLFGLTFHELEDLPTWHPDQQVFEVKEADGSHLGILYLDFFTRPSKRGGAWMNSLRSQSKLDGEVTPIVTTNFNFPPPTEDSPSLLSFSEAQTLFHEFGHALHGLLSNVTYRSLSGTSVPRDFVEFPSQVMENWMGEPEVMKLYAKHYETGEVIPDELIAKIKASGTFNQGFATVEYLSASYLDMAWHSLSEPVINEASDFEKAEMDRIGLIKQIIPRYRSTYFNHIFGGDPSYSSGYYSYIWSEVLDADAFMAFKETSLFDQETAAKFRHMLSQGGSRPGMDLYVEFRGKEPEIEPLLVKRGLK